MFCKTCGTQIDNDSIFCSFCGSKQSDIHKPISNTTTSLGQIEQKSINVNSAFGRQPNLTPIQDINEYRQPKYDLAYEKESDATFFGVVLLIISLIFVFVSPIKFDNEDSYNQYRVFSSIGALIIRIIAIVWVVNVTKRQNREQFGYGLLAFFIPSIALIIVGQLKKLYKEPNTSEQSEASVTGIPNLEEQGFNYKILNETESFDFIWGNHITYKIEFISEKKGEVYKGVNSGKYFFSDYRAGKVYCETFDNAVYNLYLTLHDKNYR